MFPKKPYKKYKPTRVKRGQFSKKDIEKIKERDELICVLCGNEATEIHHVIYKSKMGRGVYTNGISLCQPCHIKAHSDNEIRKFLEETMTQLYGPNFYKDEYDN